MKLRVNKEPSNATDCRYWLDIRNLMFFQLQNYETPYSILLSSYSID